MNAEEITERAMRLYMKINPPEGLLTEGQKINRMEDAIADAVAAERAACYEVAISHWRDYQNGGVSLERSGAVRASATIANVINERSR